MKNSSTALTRKEMIQILTKMGHSELEANQSIEDSIKRGYTTWSFDPERGEEIIIVTGRGMDLAVSSKLMNQAKEAIEDFKKDKEGEKKS